MTRVNIVEEKLKNYSRFLLQIEKIDKSKNEKLRDYNKYNNRIELYDGTSKLHKSKKTPIQIYM